MIRLASALRLSTHPEGVLAFDTRDGKIFSANKVGARILELIGAGCGNRDQIESTIAREFEAPPEVVGADVSKFIRSLESRGLLQS